MPSKRGREIVTARQLVARAAQTALVSPEELDRAIVLGQIAYFLTSHRRIGRSVAFKGGAVMKLLDGSPRFSGDLDGVAVAGKRIEQRWIEEALWANPEAARVFLAKPAWPGDLVVSGGAPVWAAVEPGILSFRRLLSRRTEAVLPSGHGN